MPRRIRIISRSVGSGVSTFCTCETDAILEGIHRNNSLMLLGILKGVAFKILLKSTEYQIGYKNIYNKKSWISEHIWNLINSCLIIANVPNNCKCPSKGTS